jgi:glycosyltransferase involved in cell wall biosynthesis
MNMRDKRLKVALLIPAYNEGKVIRRVVKKLRATFEGNTKYVAEVIVIDDGSKDNTCDEARLGGAYVIQHLLNTGQGGAIATGLSYARQKGFDIAATSDADGQHDPADVLRGVEILSRGNIDLLIGSRLINKEGMSALKVLGNVGLSLITNLLFGVRVTDSQSGLRIFSNNALGRLTWKTHGYEVCSEMLWRAKQQQLRISEYPIQAIYTDYSKAKGQSNWNGVHIVKTLIRHRIMELIDE